MLSTLSAIALLYAAVCALLFFAQRSLLYFPVPGVQPQGAERLDLPVAGATLRIWARPSAGPDALVYFGGNAEDVGQNFADFTAALPRHAVYLVNYRGYGGSTGAPTEAALFADALAVFDHVRTRHANIAVAGRSLGSGVAVHLARERPVSRVVLVTPYDSIANVAAGIYPFLPVRWLIRDKFDSGSRIGGVRVPALVVIAEHDEVIPRVRSETLVAKFAKGQARVEVVAGATHNTLEYSGLLAAFLGG